MFFIPFWDPFLKGNTGIFRNIEGVWQKNREYSGIYRVFLEEYENNRRKEYRGCSKRITYKGQQMGIMGPHAPYEARRVVLMAGYGTLDPLGAHARARMARGGRGGRGPGVPKKEIQFFRNLQAVLGSSSYRMGDSYRDSSKPHVKF